MIYSMNRPRAFSHSSLQADKFPPIYRMVGVAIMTTALWLGIGLVLFG